MKNKTNKKIIPTSARDILLRIAVFAGAVVMITSCKPPKHTETIPLSGVAGFAPTEAAAMEHTYHECIPTITLNAINDFQEYSKEDMAVLTQQLVELRNSVEYILTGTLNPKGISSGDSTTLDGLGAKVCPIGQYIDPCADLRAVVDSLEIMVNMLANDSTARVPEFRNKLNSALTGPDGDISSAFWSSAGLFPLPKEDVIDTVNLTVRTIERLWEVYGNPLPYNGAEIQALYNLCNEFLTLLGKLENERIKLVIRKEELGLCETTNRKTAVLKRIPKSPDDLARVLNTPYKYKKHNKPTEKNMNPGSDQYGNMVTYYGGVVDAKAKSFTANVLS